MIWDVLSIFLQVYYTFPLLMFLFRKISPFLLFNHWRSWEKSSKFEDLDALGINSKGARNFYLKSKHDGIQLGIWQMLPYNELVDDQADSRKFELALADDRPIFILYHGDGHHRAVRMHVGRQKFLSSLGYHVFTMDYRGFGEVKGMPRSDTSLGDDALTLFEYVRHFAPSKEIVLFGSSLGSGISSTLVKTLNENPICKPPTGILFDSTFESIQDVMYYSKFSNLFMGLIGFRSMFYYYLDILNVRMDVVNNLKDCSCPITIVHSEDDHMLNVNLAERVYNRLLELGLDVKFYNLGCRGFRHNRNYMAEEMPQILSDLLKRGRVSAAYA